MPPSLITISLALHLVLLLLLQHFTTIIIITATATELNAFTVVVVKESAVETLRRAPVGAVLQLPPYKVRLSSNWTVVERSVWSGEAAEENEEEGQLLHCRLPLPQMAEDVVRLEEEYVQRHESRTSADIWLWLMRLTQSDGCIFGDGEGPLTGVSEWYLLCPKGELRKMNRTAMTTLFGNSSSFQTERSLRRFIRQTRGERMRSRSGSSSGSDNKWSFVIGAYRNHITRPRWNSKRRVWELIYPSKRICNVSMTSSQEEEDDEEEVSIFRKDNDELLTKKFDKVERWESVIRFYCSEKRKNDHVQHWSITEVRQACLHEILFHSPVVCEWERELVNLHVNPIPCVSI
ncbi:uncharacterized protein TM35_000081330 [Trypanosoma theileri]|uniref:Uncharacterized protein n=1 Tax=Trypanosoma theileri TaxID=67003 RepID=A0A1X0P090_9TRYP|nr:uncharacterized protein TM35_000081330 [Trypanosoma theileri]ORC90335.1 hypothetical protein TM35_000081330 [Trypanosoma theileri]